MELIKSARIRRIRLIRVPFEPFREENMLHEDITSQIIAAFYKVYNTLGYGFLEKVYENALAMELAERGFTIKQQVPVQVYYQGRPVGEYFADLFVDDKVIVELKAAEEIVKGHAAQLVNYLKATKIQVGLLLNFGPKPEFMRKIFTGINKLEKYPHKSVPSA
jgi:GxxExxY protein